jgi:hypothetical protein
LKKELDFVDESKQNDIFFTQFEALLSCVNFFNILEKVALVTKEHETK